MAVPTCAKVMFTHLITKKYCFFAAGYITPWRDMNTTAELPIPRKKSRRKTSSGSLLLALVTTCKRYFSKFTVISNIGRGITTIRIRTCSCAEQLSYYTVIVI